jgi:hypothetical protein
MVEVVLGRNSSKRVGNKGVTKAESLLKSRRAEGLPMYAIGILIIGIIILAVVLIFVFGVSGQGTNLSKSIFNIQGNVTSNASATAKGFAGG